MKNEIMPDKTHDAQKQSVIREDNTGYGSLFSKRSYLLIFFLFAFVVSAGILILVAGGQITLQEPLVNAAYIAGYVLAGSTVATLLYGWIRRITIVRPTQKILEMTECITKGDFTARLSVNQRKRKRNEFDRIFNNLNLMAEELSGTETLRTDFISNVSHELKTPLAVISNYARLLEAPELPEGERLQHAAAIQQQTTKLSELITNILKLNKLDNQQIQPRKDSYDLSEQLISCILEHETVFQEKEIRLLPEIEDGIRIFGDAEMMLMVWNNLLSNAVKFSESGGTIEITAHRNQKEATVRIRDHGCGMDQATLIRVFDKFYQGDTSHATAGNGLGLTLVKRVLDLCGGSISVESTPGEGSTFTVRLPV